MFVTLIVPALASRSCTAQLEHPVSQSLIRVKSAPPALEAMLHERLSPIMNGRKHRVASELTHAQSMVSASTAHARPSPRTHQATLARHQNLPPFFNLNLHALSDQAQLRPVLAKQPSALPDIIATIDMTADLHYQRQQQHQLRDKLKQIFKHQPINNAVRHRKLDHLIEHKVAALIVLKITADELERRLSNAERIDQVTAVLQGLASASSFATASISASIYAHTMAYPSDPKHAAIIGAMVGAIDTVLGPIINASCRVTYYTQATSEQLEPAMHQYVPLHRRDTYSETSLTMASLTIPYTCRNIVAGSINSAAAYFNHAALPFTSNLLCENLLALPAGIASTCFTHYREKQDGLSGRAYLLARTDWLASLEELKHGVMTIQRARNLLSRSLNGCIAGLKALPNATLKLISATGMAEITILAAGLALSNYMQSLIPAAATPFKTEANKQMMNTLCMSNVYAIFSSVAAVAGRHGWNVNWSRIWQALVSGQKYMTSLTDDFKNSAIDPVDLNNNTVQFTSLSNKIYTITADSQLSHL